MRDDFSVATKDLLAKRVGFHCSNPECQRPTSGPQVDPAKAINLGVAAHISAAAPGGPRYEADLSPEQRCDSSNGIWLCQICAKLIDNDPARFSRPVIEGWKRAAERAALMALTRGIQRSNSDHPPSSNALFQTPGNATFAKLERLMPALLEEMREDLVAKPTSREFVILKTGWLYNSDGPYLSYFLDGHEDLPGKLQILENHAFIRNVTRTNVQRFRFAEEFVDYLTGGA
jgi:hypothetical protein